MSMFKIIGKYNNSFNTIVYLEAMSTFVQR